MKNTITWALMFTTAKFFTLCLLTGSFLTANAQTVDTYTSGTTNWTVPSGVTSIVIECWGGGGGGGGAYSSAGTNNFAGGSGGGGGGYSKTTYSVTAGTVYNIVVGGGGVAGYAGSGGTAAGTGGSSIVKNPSNVEICKALGGPGGNYGQNTGSGAAVSGAAAGIGSDVTRTGGASVAGSGGTTTSGRRGGGGGGGAGSGGNGGTASGATGGTGAATGGGNGGAGSTSTGASGSSGSSGSTIGGGGGGGLSRNNYARYGGSGARGEVRITYTICVAPTALTYTSNTVAYCVNAAIADNTPSFTGAAATSYAVSPALPTGLSLNTTTGVISGTPTVPTAAANYTVTVTNACGNTTRDVNITVQSADNNPGVISVPLEICAGTTATISNVTAASTGTPASTGPTYYFYWRQDSPTVVGWTMYESTTNSSSTLPSTVTNNPGVYYVARNSAFACTNQTNDANTVNIPITVNAVPTSTVTRTPTGPQFTGTVVTFTANPSGGAAPYSYTWTTTPLGASIGATPATGSGQVFTTTLTNSDAYNVSPPSPSITVSCLVTDDNGCSVSSGLSPAVYPDIQTPQGTLSRCPGSGTTQLTTGTCMPAASGTSGYTGFNWTISPGSAGSISNTGLITWNSAFTGNATVAVNAVGAASSATVGTQHSGIKSVVISVSSGYTAPTSVTGSTTLCHGGSVTLTSNGGTSGTGVDIWYDAACSNAFEENWNTQSYGLSSTTVNSTTGGILNLTSITNDPMIFMTGLGSFDPVVNKYVHIRYRVLSGTAGSAEMFFLNTVNTGANQSYAASGALISDGNWHVLNIDMSANSNWTSGGNITGFRYDWAGNNNVQMELDFISLSANRILETGSSYTVTPSGTTTYYVNRTGSCGSTSCVSHTITMPVAGNLLSGNESATCVVSGNNWIHFYNETTGKLIVSINPNGNNLGNVTATSYVDGSAILTQTCGTGTNPSYTTAAMGRRWTIAPQFQPVSSVSVKFPYESTELASLVTASAGTTQNPFDNVSTASDLKLSKYAGANQDGSWSNNCADGGTIILLTQGGQGAIASGNGYINNINSGSYVQFGIPGFSEFWLHNAGNSSPLPVQLTDLSATCQETDEVVINWSTASEYNSQKFLVEKSRDLVQWVVTDDIPAAGSSGFKIDYTSTDVNPFNGISYYRINQLDNNGIAKIYGPISVSCSEPENKMNVFPNPAEGTFTVEISSTDTGEAKLQVTDLAGKTVSLRSIHLWGGKIQVLFDETDLQTGTYIVQLISENSLIRPVKVLVK